MKTGIRILAILGGSVLLAACANGARNGAPAAVYDFGMPAARLADDGAWSRMAVEIKAPYWFDSLSIEYRLNYDDPLKLREYGGSRWAGAPALLLGQRLRQQLGTHGATSDTAVDCLLRFEVQEFSQVFDTPQQSRGVLHGNLTLLDGKRRPLAGRQIAIERASPSPDARGGVGALLAASDELGRQIAGWLDSLPPDAAACRMRR